MGVFQKRQVHKLSDWVEIATKKLSTPVKKRIQLEIEAHYAEAVAAHIAEGLPESDAERMALDELGNAPEAAKHFRKLKKIALTAEKDKGWRYAIGVVVVGTVFVWAQATLCNLNPNFCNGNLNSVFFAIASILKLLTLSAIAWGLSHVFRHLQGNGVRALQGIIVWSLIGLALLAVLSVLRPKLEMLSFDSSAYWFPTNNNGSFPAEDYQSFIQRWHSGQLIALEAAFVIACSAFLGLAGFLAGRFRILKGAAVLTVLGIVTLFGGLGFGLLSVDYDTFMCGTMFGPITYEIMIPFAALYPTTQIGFLVYLALILSSYALTRHWMRAEKAADFAQNDQQSQEPSSDRLYLKPMQNIVTIIVHE